MTDGVSTVISRVIDDDSNTVRAASMYFSCGTEFKRLEDGMYRMAHRDRKEEVVIVASEKLTSAVEVYIRCFSISIPIPIPIPISPSSLFSGLG